MSGPNSTGAADAVCTKGWLIQQFNQPDRPLLQKGSKYNQWLEQLVP